MQELTTTSTLTGIIDTLVVCRAGIGRNDKSATSLVGRGGSLPLLDGRGGKGIALAEAAVGVGAAGIVGHAHVAGVAGGDPQTTRAAVGDGRGAGACAEADDLGAVGTVGHAHLAVGARRELETTARGGRPRDQCDKDGKG